MLLSLILWMWMLLFLNTIDRINIFIHLKEHKIKYISYVIISIKIIQIEHSKALLTIIISTNLNM